MFYTNLGILIAAILTLCIYSFLYKDNPFYRLAEHIFVGISAGYWVAYYFRNAIIPNFLNPLFREQRFLLIIPGILSLLIFTRFTRRWNWLLRYPISSYIGIGFGLSITATLQTDVLPQIQATFLPFNSFNNILMAVGVACVLIYFYFSREHKGALGGAAEIGIWFLMISFGAYFGYTVMSRISLLIGRMNFLLSDWLHLVK